ncbi:MAG: hypothetical protein JXR95_03995 [Deltaproteobacteria bacterium]|nr:hypothetical protein [Deltaproteobacteria bacterium]
MIARILFHISLAGKFLWDPEKLLEGLSVSFPEKLESLYLLGGLLTLLGFLYYSGYAHLTCWTPRFFTPFKMAGLLAGYFMTVVLITNFKKFKSKILILSSGVITLMASVPLAVLSSVTVLLYFLVLKFISGKLIRHLLVAAIIASMLLLYNFKLFPEVVFSDFWGVAGLMWAFFIPLRLIWFHYQVSRESESPEFSEIILYFFMIPAPIMLPYMFALPRRKDFSSIFQDNNSSIKIRGTVYIVTGIIFYLAYNVLDKFIIHLSTLNHMKWILLPWSYPFEPVFYALGSAYLISGLYNRLGADVSLAFKSPLNSHSILEWWRRWNVHFRDMLVEIFFYPVVMGRGKNPYLRLWTGTFGVFIVGSTLLHWMVKHYFSINDAVFYWSMLIENTIMFLAVGSMLHYERYSTDKNIRKRREARKLGKKISPPVEKSNLVRLSGYLATWTLVFFSVMFGYASNLFINGTYIDQGTAVMYYAFKLEKQGNITDAKYYFSKSSEYFSKSLLHHNDVSSPWRIKERHAAMKLILVKIHEENLKDTVHLLKLLKWDITLSENARILKEKVLYELEKMKGLSGIKRIFQGDSGG